MMAEDHPEELIDRARLGALEPEEQSKLDRHLAVCGACMVQMAHGPQFERELAPQPRDELLVGRALDAAMLRMQRSSSVNRGRSWPRWLQLAAAGVLLASGIAAAAAIVVRKSSSPAPAVSAAARPVELRASHSSSPAPSLSPASMPSAAFAPPAAGEAPEQTAEVLPTALEPRASTVRPTVTAAMLFERAGKLRREGRVDAAIGVYRRLQESFPEAREVQLSFALAGQLLLDRGRPGDALAQFDRHSRRGGDVGEEALVGRATALEQLHRTAEAIAAWRNLLERYPGSIYAARARARLEQLGARP